MASRDNNRHEWHDRRKHVCVSGTVIQKEVMTNSKVCEVAPNAIHFYQMCALKVMNESVIEGVCMTVAKHA